MSSIVASEVWNELKRYVNTVDRQEAAETLVAVLIDHDEDVEDIRDAFKHDSDVKRALTAYLDNDKNYEDEDSDEDLDEDSNDDWEN
jgi:uncharacterized membrane protein YhiD involved in acid resistance